VEEPLVVWKNALAELEGRLQKTQIEAWIAPLRPIQMEGNTLILGVGSELQRTYLVKNCQSSIEEAVQKSSSLPINIRFDLDPRLAPVPISPQPVQIMRPAPPPEEVAGIVLNEKYTFESFVVGNSNKFAHAAAQGVAENPGRGHNPLFLYGGVGLGKTHLLHAIGHYFHKHNPGKRMVHITCERFTNNMIECLRDQNMAEFRRKYRQVDLLLIDDIQFLQGREATQEEFFHTFNDLYITHRQIVMTSDTHPNEIKLEDRLRSRFQSGLVADLQIPDIETRIAILKKKAMVDGLSVPEDVFIFVAETVKSNIREIEGALKLVMARAAALGLDPSLETAREALSGLIATPRVSLNFERIMSSTARYFNIETNLLSEKTRTDAIVHPRQIAMYLCRELLGSSYVAIGNQFGGRDHSTVLYGIDKIRNLIQTDQQVNLQVSEIRKLLES